MTTLGRVYRCPICGAEISVVRTGSGELAAVCCGTPMLATGRVSATYRCPECGAEVMVVLGTGESFEPICCNVPMSALNKAA
jgi:desulfoferrodoxin-like iron-binding protein